MKSLPVAVVLVVLCASQASAEYDPCKSNGLIEFRESLESFTTLVSKKIAPDYDYDFLISPLNIWLSLAAIAEGAEASVQRELFDALLLPQQRCLREKFYYIALHSLPPGDDVKLQMRRGLFINEYVKTNPLWSEYVNRTGLMDFFYDMQLLPGETSVIADILQYDGLWTTAFSEDGIGRAPFYDESGLQVGEIDLMRTSKSMRAAHLEDLNAKVLELPVGINGRYTMLILMGLENHPIREIVEILPKSIILQITQALHYKSYVPSEVGVPKIRLHTLINATMSKLASRKSGMTQLRANPPPVPTEYAHEIHINLNSAGINPAPTPGSDPGHAADVGEEFIVKKAFMYFLIEPKTNSVIFVGAYNPKYLRYKTPRSTGNSYP